MKDITLKVPDYTPSTGIRLQWEDNFSLAVATDGTTVTISANREGLLSLANHLLNLTQEEAPAGVHIHLDSHGGLEDGSTDLVIEKL